MYNILLWVYSTQLYQFGTIAKIGLSVNKIFDLWAEAYFSFKYFRNLSPLS